MLCSVGVSSSRFGDIDGDGEISLADISMLINRYLASTLKAQDDESPAAADSVTIDDITSLIHTYLAVQQADAPSRACVLDMTGPNHEIEISLRNVYSAEYMLELAGMPCFTTGLLTEALKDSRMIVLSSELRKDSFTAEQLDSLYAWVGQGGVLVAPGISAASSSAFLSGGGKKLFGIESVTQTKARYRLIWDEQHFADKELEYIDEEEERVTSLARGKTLEGESIKTFGYTLATDTATEVLAHFETGENAVIRRSIGRGRVYVFGFLWRDIIQRSQLNKDFSAQRNTSNAFEPSADVVPLFLRSAFARQQKVSVWKFTVPDGYESLIIPTHDCDSRTAYDSMYYMSEYERDLKVKSHFFLTVHYFRDAGYLSAFYDDITKEKARLLLTDGHTVGSHSVCHFPDFSQTDRFPLTVVSREEYAAVAHHAADNITTGGSTWAEVVLSKQIIEDDLHNTVRSFRTGHLCMNKNIPEAEQEAGYHFASCYGAGDVLSEFPFRERLSNEWWGEFNGVLQMPLHISDVISSSPINADNWMEKPSMWHTVQGKLQGNYAPAILLIHPNRKWKMEAEKLLVEMTDTDRVGLYNFEDYGDFWNRRRALQFDYSYDNSQSLVDIYLTDDETAEDLQHLAFGIDVDTDAATALRVRALDATGRVIAVGTVKQLSPHRLLVWF